VPPAVKRKKKMMYALLRHVIAIVCSFTSADLKKVVIFRSFLKHVEVQSFTGKYRMLLKGSKLLNLHISSGIKSTLIN